MRTDDEPRCGQTYHSTRLQECRDLNNAVVMGPLVLPYALLLVFAAVAAAQGVAKLVGRRAGIDVELVLWKTLLVGFVAARLAFVWEFRSAYFASPLG